MIIWKLLKNKYIILSESKLCNLTGFISSSRSVRLQFQKNYILKIEYIYKNTYKLFYIRGETTYKMIQNLQPM